MAPIRIRKITTHTIIKLAFLLLACAMLVSYGIYQARALISGPTIVIEEGPTLVSGSRMIEVAGHAENITKITLNGHPIHTDEAGAFAEEIMLQNGYTIVTLTAEDRYGRTTSVTRSYVYEDTLEEKT